MSQERPGEPGEPRVPGEGAKGARGARRGQEGQGKSAGAGHPELPRSFRKASAKLPQNLVTGMPLSLAPGEVKLV